MELSEESWRVQSDGTKHVLVISSHGGNTEDISRTSQRNIKEIWRKYEGNMKEMSRKYQGSREEI